MEVALELLVYLGVGFLLCGFFMVMVSSTAYPYFSPFVVLGGLVSAMGIILSFVALKATEKTGSKDHVHNYDNYTAGHSLLYLETEMDRFQMIEKRTNGNKAFGFVLVSLGVFILAVSSIFGFIYLWPVSVFGTGSLIGGIILHRRV